jgi:hypothetical protein
MISHFSSSKQANKQQCNANTGHTNAGHAKAGYTKKLQYFTKNHTTESQS